VISVRLIALAVALGSAGAAQAEVIEVGSGGTVKVLSDAPNATWTSADEADQPGQVEAIEGGPEVPATAVTVLKEQGWSGAYAKALVDIATANDISPYLLEAVVWQESRWNPTAVSRAGAIGLAQLMPGTARDLGVDPRDPVQNLSGGARYLRQQLNRFDGNVEKALAAYNAGPGRVMTAGGIPSIPETQAYVRAIVARLAANSIQEGKRQ
jgi:soluble lytic murein transglycosylase-like protein